MTNGEKFLNDYYPNSSITRDSLTGRVFVNEDNADFTLPIEWWDAEYKEPTTKNDLGVDCIDRNSIKYYSGHGGYMYASKGEIDKLPPVTPQEPRKGHWIDSSNGWMCSECNRDNTYDTSFCPNCGADMRGNTKRKGKPIEGNNESYNCENWIP